MTTTLYKGNDHKVSIASLTDEDDVSVTGATATWELTTTAGVQVATGSLTADGAGGYAGIIESSGFSGQSVGTVLLLLVTAVSSTKNADWTEPVVVGYRRIA
jgi:hypothetical protein